MVSVASLFCIASGTYRLRRARQKILFIARILPQIPRSMPNRIDDKFASLRAAGKKAFIAYICAGDPSLDATRDLALAFDQLGVDVLELGVPFSDPLADGIVNQLASQRALESGATARGVLDCVRAIRQRSQIPIVLYTYMNPVYAFGFEKFHREAEAAGVDGLLLLDLPPDEDAIEFVVAGNLKHIRLIAPTTPPARIAQITKNADGFIYYISREGVTGERAAVADSLDERIAAIRKTTTLPITVGFGVSSPETAKQTAQCGDGVVVGSAIVKRIAENAGSADMVEKVCVFLKPLIAAVKV
jgi:tryptophan synthase alpha chain